MNKDILKTFFKKEDSTIVVTTYKCEIFVPKSYFEAKLAVQDGELYDLFFILKFKLYHDEKSEGKSMEVNDFFFPTMMPTKPDETYTTELDLFGGKEKFEVFVYYKGSPIIYNTGIVKNSILVERYVQLLNDGKIRALYRLIDDITNKSQKIHDVKLNVPRYIQQLIISEVYRDAKDYSRPARLVAKADDMDNSKVKGLNMRENSAFTSTLAGVSFEDIKSMLVVADNRDDKDSKDVSSIEKVIKGIK
jgi:hypothetical protein